MPGAHCQEPLWAPVYAFLIVRQTYRNSDKYNYYQERNRLLLLYIQLTIYFLIGRKRTVNFRNQHLGHHLAADPGRRTPHVKGVGTLVGNFELNP